MSAVQDFVTKRSVGQDATAKPGRAGPSSAARPPRRQRDEHRPVVQRKLAVGAVDDPLEREADRIADAVTHQLHDASSERAAEPVRLAASGRIRRSSTSNGAPGAPGGVIGAEGGEVSVGVASRIERASAGGAPLDGSTLRRMSGAFGTDFTNVRVHRGTESEELNSALGARAFTTGSHVFLGKGVADAGTAGGDRLLAHELTHTIQQTGGGDAVHRSVGLVQRDDTGTAVKENPLYKGTKSGGDNPLFTGAKTPDYPKVGEVRGEAVIFEKDGDEFEARVIMDSIEVSYGVTIRSDKLAKAIPSNYAKAPKDVRKAVEAGVWQMKELRAIERALAHFAPILGSDRKDTTRGKSSQEVQYIGKVKKAIDQNGSGGTLDDTTMGEYFKKQKTLGLFDAGTDSTQDFTDNLKQLEGTAVHEMAHGLFGYAVKDWAKEFDFWDDQYNESGKPNVEKPPSSYGETNAAEDLCESVMFYFVEESKLKKDAPLRHAYLVKLISAWKKDDKKKKSKK